MHFLQGYLTPADDFKSRALNSWVDVLATSSFLIMEPLSNCVVSFEFTSCLLTSTWLLLEIIPKVSPAQYPGPTQAKNLRECGLFHSSISEHRVPVFYTDSCLLADWNLRAIARSPGPMSFVPSHRYVGTENTHFALNFHLFETSTPRNVIPSGAGSIFSCLCRIT